MTAEFERLCPSHLLDASEITTLGCELQRARDLAERLGCSATVERIDERERTLFAVELTLELRDRSAPPPSVHKLASEFDEAHFDSYAVRYDSLNRVYRVVLMLGIAARSADHVTADASRGASASSDDETDDASTGTAQRRSRRLRDQKPEFDSKKLERVLRNEPTTARALGLSSSHRVPSNVKLHAPVRQRKVATGPRRVITKKPLKRARSVAEEPSWLRWAASKVTLGLIGVDPSYTEAREAYERELAESYADFPDLFAPPVIL